MEADWEVEIGGDAPAIEAYWDGLIDLRRAPECASRLPEARQFPPLARALVDLNSTCSPVWTTKCDVWSPVEFDPDELDAPREEGNCALACYIDLIPHDQRRWPTPEKAASECREACTKLRKLSLRCGRADFVVRRVILPVDRPECGVTVYVTACGATPESVRANLESTLIALVATVVHVGATSQLQ